MVRHGPSGELFPSKRAAKDAARARQPRATPGGAGQAEQVSDDGNMSLRHLVGSWWLAEDAAGNLAAVSPGGRVHVLAPADDDQADEDQDEGEQEGSE